MPQAPTPRRGASVEGRQSGEQQFRFRTQSSTESGGRFDTIRTLPLDVLGQPAEAFAVALPFQHAAHEHLQWASSHFRPGDLALPGGLGVQAKVCPEVVFTGRSRFVDLVAQNQHWAVCQLLVSEQAIQFGFGLRKSFPVVGIY